MIELIAAASIGGIVGFGICAVLTAGKVADSHSGTWLQGYNVGFTDGLHDGERGHTSAHTRCADALGTTQRKLSAIRDLLDKPRTIRKGELASILDGDV